MVSQDLTEQDWVTGDVVDKVAAPVADWVERCPWSGAQAALERLNARSPATAV
jgi:hypothetical protein